VFEVVRALSGIITLIVGFSYYLLFHPENGGDKFLRNVCGPLPKYTSHPRKFYSARDFVYKIFPALKQ
jgi:hypothetical protein